MSTRPPKTAIDNLGEFGKIKPNMSSSGKGFFFSFSGCGFFFTFGAMIISTSSASFGVSVLRPIFIAVLKLM